MEIAKDVDDVEIRLSAELDETSFQDTEYAVWVRNGEFKYETTVDPSKSDGKESKPKAADEKKLLADSSTDTRQVLASGTPSVLHGISVAVKPGELVAIVGQVGSGKSSLIQAILGELNKLKGDVVVRGSVAYVAQTAFIMNATLKENVLFGLPYDEARYKTAVDVCCLRPDIAILPAGDETEIGERGINLSGGQRQRVSLARAVYRDADVYLLDDPLSAVDAHVGSRIFNDAICGVLYSKTRLLVTHGLQYITRAHSIYVLQEGTIAERGTFDELVSRPNSLLSAVVATYESEAKDAYDEAKAASVSTTEPDAVGHVCEVVSSHGEPDKVPAVVKDAVFDLEDADMTSSDSDTEIKSGSTTNDHQATKSSESITVSTSAKESAAKFGRTQVLEAGKQTTAETRSVGSVNKNVYWHYASAVGGCCTMLVIFVFYAVMSGLGAVGNWWLSYWSDEIAAPDNTHSSHWYLGIYALITFCNLVISLVLRVYYVFSTQRAATLLHEKMLSTVMYAYQSFFDTTPLGRILNRFSQDQYLIDEGLPDSFAAVFSMFFSVMSTMIVIIIVTPLFLVLIIPLIALYVFTQRFYVASSRELKRLESVTKSPIFAQFSETLNGTVTIRAYGDHQRFVTANHVKLDVNQKAYFLGTVANRWLAVRLEMIGAVIVTGASLFAIIARSSISPALAGLSISYALSITQNLNWFVRVTAEVESKIVAVERLREFSVLPVEPSADSSNTTVPRSWPSEGRIIFRDLKLKYRFETPYVLHGISAVLKPHEKVGICGRTGAGKSSLISALYRLADVQEGDVIIDGINIADVSLQELRSRLAIIPQEPTLFSGTIRRNLDPMDETSDDDIWNALDMVSLKTVLQRKPEGLDAPVTEGGENWSHGQRQLICMARALLKKSKVVILDEATAACDVETDAILQRTIRRAFADSTVLTIAHRVHTILDSDRIMVLDQGKIVEFDTPKKLLSNPASQFSRLLADSATASSDVASAKLPSPSV